MIFLCCRLFHKHVDIGGADTSTHQYLRGTAVAALNKHGQQRTTLHSRRCLTGGEDTLDTQ